MASPPVFFRRRAPFGWAVAAFLLLLPCLLLFPALFGNQSFLPADLLSDIYPWKAAAVQTNASAESAATPWNVLRFDGITQFYGWRLMTAQSLQSGHIPLWNPTAFAGENGTPLLANSQSAPLYPPNWILFDWFPAAQMWRAFGLSVAFHLIVALWGMYRFLRSLPLKRASAALGATVWGLSAPIVTWLALPTFLCVTSWLPLLLWLIKVAHEKAGTPQTVGLTTPQTPFDGRTGGTRQGGLVLIGAGGVGGLVLLAGHLQMAFYVLLAAFLYATFLAWHKARGMRPASEAIPASAAAPRFLVRWAIGLCLGFGLAFFLALPQLLPSLELSRQSHRASSGGPTASAYSAYVANALPPRNLVTLLVPDFFGHPNKNKGQYWNTNNFAEWAVYVGVLPLLLAVFALALPWRGAAKVPLPKERAFGAFLLAFALLLAMGTPLNAVFFWGVPGYNQTGNPARCLILWAFALSLLAALGLEAIGSPYVPAPAKKRAALVALVVPVFLAAVGASLAAQFANANLPTVPFGDLMTLALPNLQMALVWLLLSVGAVVALLRLPAERQPLARAICVLLCAADLLAFGVGYNPTALPQAVFPVTPGLAYLQTNGPNALIAPINRGWSLTSVPPARAVLPPNTLSAYNLHDVGGYDSLFPGVYKMRAKNADNGVDASPLENGNMIFVKTPQSAVVQQARFLVFAPNAAPDETAPMGDLRRVYSGADMVIYENPAGRDIARIGASAFAAPYPATAFRLGLWAGLFAVGAMVAVGSAAWFRHLR